MALQLVRSYPGIDGGPVAAAESAASTGAGIPYPSSGT